MKSLAILVLLACSTAIASMTVDSAKVSSSFNTVGNSYLTDEGSRRIPLIGVVLPDSSGHTSLSDTYFVKNQYSPVTGLEGLPQYKLASGVTVPIYALAAIDPSSRAPVTLSSVLASSVTLAGDVTGAAGSNTVALIDGSTAANVHAAELAANAATDANTASTIVKRDSSGNFTAGTVTASLAGNVTGNLTGTPTIPIQAASTTPACAAGQNGELAFTSLYVLCVCNTSGWVKTADGSTACTF